MMVHGVSKNADLDPSLMQREIRPFRYQVADFFSFAGGPVTMFLGFLVFASTLTNIIGLGNYSSLSDILIVVTLLSYFFAKKYEKQYPLRRPMNPNEINKKTKKPLGDGLILIGNDLMTNESFWVSNDDARTHMLVMGSTGSGKTRFLLSLFYQALLMGSGVMYVDGKGDTTVFGLVFSMVRRLGREDDLMVINYLTGSKGVNKEDDGTRLSNTNNPFAYGPAETLRSLIVSLMPDSGGDDMWKNRASALLAATLQTLVYLRDTGEINLDVGVIRDSLPLDRICDFTQRDDLPEIAITLLNKYLLELPGFNLDEALSGNISAKCYEQHGYLIMQLTGVLSELSSTYAHIFDAPLGEVDYKDLVYNRRILFVMLPALEKDPDALSGLGKLVVAGVRSALAPALGEKVEGSHEEVMDAKPTNSNVPFLLIMDEYGYYSVKGFSVVAAQARSLGMSVVFAGQDFPSFKKGSEDEAKSVVANTNIKVFMKLEDSGETLTLAVDRGGEGETASSAGHEIKGELFSGYADNQQTRSERRKRINVRDLVSQKPGEAHVIFGDILVRCKLYFTDPRKSPEYRINKMLMVNAPRGDMVKKIHEARDSVKRLFDKGQDTSRGRNAELDGGLKALFNAYGVAIARKQEPVLASQIAFGLMEKKERLLDDAFVRALKGGEPTAAKGQEPAGQRPKEATHAAAAPQPARPATPTERKAEAILNTMAEEDLRQEPKRSQDLEKAIESLPFMRAPESSDSSIKAEADEIFVSLSSIITDTVRVHIEKSTVALSPAAQELALPVNQLAAIEAERGLSKEEAMAEARRGMDILDERIQYPAEPQPTKLSKDTISKTVELMLQQIKKNKNAES